LTIIDDNIVCPRDGTELELVDELLFSKTGREYRMSYGIPLLHVEQAQPTSAATAEVAVEDAVTRKVQAFYQDAPFPNYNSHDTLEGFVRQAKISVFAQMLQKQIPLNAKVLEVGCGTGQLSNFLAATTMSRVYATDMTLASLQLGQEFAQKNKINGIRFVQMNLFAPAIRSRSMDLVISNGVLHHTHDTKKAFMSIARLVRPGGFILIGLYNHIGRLRTDFRRALVRAFGEGILVLDPILRRNPSTEKRKAWIQDQYFHPQERKHSISELIQWFDEADFSFVSSIPKITGTFGEDIQLFKPQSCGTAFDRFLTETGMLLSNSGGEGGLFICVGRKNPS
jgi:2-polyprenyl-3-methyl-5-hydroxy-6-metoxy-1,4-benzoquinol methylase